MELDEIIARGVKELRSRVLDADSLHRARLAVLAQVRDQAICLKPPKRRKNSRRSWLPSLAVTSLVACVALIVITFGDFVGSSNVYANAIRNLKRGGLHFIISKVADDGSLKPGIEYWISSEGLGRHVAGNSVMIVDQYGNPKIEYSLDPGVAKDAIVYKSAPRSERLSFNDTWIGLLERPGNRVKLKDNELVGKLCYEVKSADGVLQFDVIIDPQRNSIVSVDFFSANPDPLLGGKFVIRDIQVNQDFDPSLFRFNPPDGYRPVLVE